MRPPTIACIVEGHGEVEAMPRLIRRIASHGSPPRPVNVVAPLRLSRGKFTPQSDDLKRMLDVAARFQGGGPGGILLLLDADRALPCQLGPALQSTVEALRTDRAIRVVLAVTEFEAWFLAAARSLAGKAGLPPDLEPPADPEKIRSPKGWLDAHLRKATRSGYGETTHQALFCDVFDLDAAMAAPSFAKLHREVMRLLTSG